jgi:flagella basal body P-ring formation protein FlgA
MRTLLFIIALLLLPALGLAQPEAGAKRLINQQEIRALLDDFLAEESDRLPHVEFHFKSIAVPDAFEVPAGRINFQIMPAKPGVTGSRRVTLMTRVDNRIVDNQSIRVEIEALAEIVVAAENLRRGDLLSPEKLRYQQQDISKLKHPFFDADDLYGKRLKRSVRHGQALQRQQVEFPPLVERGDRVVIQVQRGGMMLSAAGEAKEDGVLDETIRVMNLGSRKVVLCRVVEAGLVTVEF